MVAKVNATIKLSSKINNVIVELWDVDVLVDDKLDSKTVSHSGPIEFLFSIANTGEFNPELQLRVFSDTQEELYRSNIDTSISMLNIDKATGFMEHTTIEFGTIEL